MTFLEAYRKRVAISRAEREPVAWFPSLGRDLTGRAAALAEAVEKGRFTIEQARTCAGAAIEKLEAALGNAPGARSRAVAACSG
jgi:hypothetical protein